MKTFYTIILAAVMASSASAEEGRSQPAIPLPRVRLDPTRRAAIAEPKKRDTGESSDGAVAMSPFIVRSTRISAEGREQDRLPTGPVSMLSGGWIYRKDNGGTRMEVGVWPYQNILWKNDRFKPDLKHVGTEFVRVSW
jgi:hypothetical protein